MNYKQAKNYLKKHNAEIIFAPVSRLQISFTGEPIRVLIQPGRRVCDTKRAAVELRKRLSIKKSPGTYHSTRGKTTTLKIPRRRENVHTY